jgi:hypothetical protein
MVFGVKQVEHCLVNVKPAMDPIVKEVKYNLKQEYLWESRQDFNPEGLAGFNDKMIPV